MKFSKILYLLLACLLGFTNMGLAQAVTTEPANPNGDEAIKIIIDVKQASDSRAAGLLGLSDGVFLWSGAGSDPNGDAFEFQPPGQSDFGAPFEPGRMTAEGDDVWSITLTPRDYYQVPQGTQIAKLGLLLKNANGSSQTEDFVLQIIAGDTASGPLVVIEPLEATGEIPVKITFDLKNSTDSRTNGLLGLSDGVFLWSGAGSEFGGNAFEFPPPGQSDFGAPFEPGRMTSEGDDVWSITLTPRDYYQVPEGTPILRLGLLLKNADGSAQTEDIVIDLQPAGLLLNLQQPRAGSLFPVSVGDTIQIKATTSELANIDILEDNAIIATFGNEDTVAFDLIASGSGTREVSLRAIAGDDTAQNAFSYLVIPSQTPQDLPAGVSDGINYVNDTTVTLVLLAPGKTSVFLIGAFSDWQIDTDLILTPTPDGNRFWITLDTLSAGQEYAFQYAVYDEQGRVARVGDPYTEKIIDVFDNSIDPNIFPDLPAYPTGKTTGTIATFQTAQTPYVWQNTDYQRPAKEELVIYELLVRDFDVEKSYQDVIDRLDTLQMLGINAIELMPIMEFSGNISWGYNPTYYFAPDKAYGPKNALKALIDSAHGRGIAVLLDMVLNQSDFECPLVKMYFENGRPTPESPWLNEFATHPFNVFYDYNHESTFTQAWVDTVNAFWLKEYRFDGFRFDLSKGFTQNVTVNEPDAVGAWSARDESRIALIKRMADQVWATDPEAIVILEHLAVNDEDQELAEYRADEGLGMMLWANENFVFNQATMGFDNNSFRGAYYGSRGWNFPHLISYMESHDEERLAYRNISFGNSSGTYNVRNASTSYDRIKAAATFYFTIPGPKMFWQFGEIGYDFSINYCADGSINEACRTDPKPIRWDYFDDPARLNLFKTFSALIKLRLDSLGTIFESAATAYNILETGNNTLVKEARLSNGDQEAWIIGNFDVVPATITPDATRLGIWNDYFTGDTYEVQTEGEPIILMPGQFHLFTSNPLPTPEAGIVPFAVADIVTAVEDPLLEQSIRIFPNPNVENFSINMENTFQGAVNLRLYDTQGNIILKEKDEKNTFRWARSYKLQNQQAGIYLLEVIVDGRRSVKRVIVVD